MAQDNSKSKYGSTKHVYYVKWTEEDDSTGEVKETYRYISYKQIDDFLEAYNVIKFLAITCRSTKQVYYVRWIEVDDSTGEVKEIYRYINYKQIDEFLENNNTIKFLATDKKR